MRGAVFLLATVGMGSRVVLGDPISLLNPGVAYTQNFDTLASTGTSSTLPTGWAFLETGTNANAQYSAGTGSSTTGDTYSFGAAGSNERALGMLRSGSLVPTIGAEFTNDTGFTITSLLIEYFGELWRLGATGRTDQIDFQYSLNATSLNSGDWIDVNALDFITPSTVSPTGAKDGNSATYRTELTSTISVSIPDGATFWIRWTDSDPSGSDDGLAVDDFSLTPTVQMAPATVPLPAAYLGGLVLMGGIFVARRWRRAHRDVGLLVA